MTVNVFSPSVYFMGIPSAPVHEWGQDVKTLCAADKLIPASLPALESIGEYYYYYSRQWNVAPHDEGLPIAKKTKRGTTWKEGLLTAHLLLPVNRIQSWLSVLARVGVELGAGDEEGASK